MINDSPTESLTREGFWKLISDDEVGSACAVETAVRLSEGDEYLDLRRLVGGVRRVHGAAIPAGHVLPRKAVDEDTWTRIVTQLAALPYPRARSTAELT